MLFVIIQILCNAESPIKIAFPGCAFRVVKSTFGLFTCITLEEELSVLRSDNGLRCHKGEHGNYVWMITIPSIFIWVIGIPLAAGLTMKHYRGMPNPLGEEGECMLYAVSIQRKFAFLYKVKKRSFAHT